MVSLYGFAVPLSNENFITGIITNVTIDTLCDIMTSPKASSPLAALASVNTFMLTNSNETCLSFTYDDMIKDFRNKEWNSNAGAGGRLVQHNSGSTKVTDFGDLNPKMAES